MAQHPEELVTQLREASELSIGEIVAAMSSEGRVALAEFCWRRTHYHELGLTILARCSAGELSRILGDTIALAMIGQARDRADRAAPQTRMRAKRKISLAGSREPAAA
jgi:hypothetical protein